MFTDIVPQPSVSITGFPIVDRFYTGLQLNLTCHIEFILAVDSGLTVSIDWTKTTSQINSNRVIKFNSEMISLNPFLFRSTLSFSSLSTESDDEGVYVCTTSVTLPQDNQFLLVPTDSSSSQIVTLEGIYISVVASYSNYYM